MISPGALLRAAAVAGVGLALAACISLFPKADPAQLYQFGQTLPAKTEPAGGPPFGVMTAVTSFDRAAASDRILTVQPSGEVAYIKGARWVTGAPAMFDQAVQRAFDADEGPARIVTRGQMGRSDYVLKLDVRRFEARYENGPEGAPTVVIEVRAALTRSNDRITAGERMFRASASAADNRVGPIAAAFDRAVSEVVGQLVAWVDAKGAG